MGTGRPFPYYPIPAEANRNVYAKWLSEAQKLKEKVPFSGRLAENAYFNVDQAVASALAKSKTISGGSIS